MKLTVEKAQALGLVPLVVYDGHGTEIKERIMEFDTKTGVVAFLQKDENGNLQYVNGKVTIKTEKFKAPLTWKSLNKKRSLE